MERDLQVVGFPNRNRVSNILAEDQNCYIDGWLETPSISPPLAYLDNSMPHQSILGLASVSVFLFAGTTLTSFAQDINSSDPVTAGDSQDLGQLRIARRDVFRELVDVLHHRFLEGSVNFDSSGEAQTNLAQAELALASTTAERIQILEDLIETLKTSEKHQVVRMKVGAGQTDELAEAKAARLEAEGLLLLETLGSEAVADNPQLRKVRVAHRDAVGILTEELRRQYLNGIVSVRVMLAAEMDLARAELALASSGNERVRIVEHLVERLTKADEDQQVRFRVGSVRSGEQAQTMAARLGAEVLLLLERQSGEAGEQSAELRKLRVAHKDALRQVADLLRHHWQEDQNPVKFILEAEMDFARADLALASGPDQRVQSMKDAIERMQMLQEAQERLFNVGAGRSDEVLLAKAARIGAEILLAEQVAFKSK